MSIPHRPIKWEVLINHYGELCPIAMEHYKKQMPVCDLHHLLHNTKPNRKKFPLLIHSLLNLRPVSNAYHLAHPSWGHVGLMDAIRKENFLGRHPLIAAWVNHPKGPLFRGKK